MTEYQIKRQKEFDELPDGVKLKRLHEVCIAIIDQSLTNANGGWSSEFGICTMNAMLLFTKFDLKDRQILKDKI